MQVVPPRTRRWFQVLPSPYNTEKPVVAFLVPMDWDCKIADTKSNNKPVMCISSKNDEKVLGLQFLDPELKTYEEHKLAFEAAGVKIPTPAYIGPISFLPQRLLLDETMTVLMFSQKEFWRRPVDLKRVWISKAPELRC